MNSFKFFPMLSDIKKWTVKIRNNEKTMMIIDNKLMDYDEKEYKKRSICFGINYVHIGKDNIEEHYEKFMKYESEINELFLKKYFNDGWRSTMTFSEANICRKIMDIAYVKKYVKTPQKNIKLKDAEMTDVDYNEMEYLSKLHGALMFCETGKRFNDVESIDVNSMYAHIFCTGLNIPVSEPIYMNCDSMDEFINGKKRLTVGLYNVKINNPLINEFPFRLMKNDNDWYTYTELNLLIDNGFSATDFAFIETDDVNYITYKNWIQNMFNDMIRDLYYLKSNGNPLAKRVLCLLYGLSSQYKISKIQKLDSMNAEERNWYSDKKYLINAKNSGIIDENCIYKYGGLGRVNRFLLCFSRALMVQNILDILKEDPTVKFYRSHTDSLMLSHIPPQFKQNNTGKELGKFKIESKIKTVVIKNLNEYDEITYEDDDKNKQYMEKHKKKNKSKVVSDDDDVYIDDVDFIDE